jgi:hypothetical protein
VAPPTFLYTKSGPLAGGAGRLKSVRARNGGVTTGDDPATVDDAAERDRPADLPDGWRVWSAEGGGRVVLAYRPDVFAGDAFPAACLPTLYVSNGSRRPRPGAGGVETDEWHVTLFVEPDVEVATRAPGDRDAALAAAVDLAARFAAGEVAYRDAYQVPRPDYLDALDRLTGRGDADEGDAGDP